MLKVNENYREINAKEQEDNEDSLLNWYRKLISLRKKSEYAEILIEGSIVPVYEDVENLIGYMRILEMKIVDSLQLSGTRTKNKPWKKAGRKCWQGITGKL